VVLGLEGIHSRTEAEDEEKGRNGDRGTKGPD
jgi:hypothetical protein